MRNSRLVGAVCAAVLCVGVLVGCTEEPVPAPTPTPMFATEEEAFAAAEEVYRAYVLEENARRTNGRTTSDVSDFLTGSALEADIRSRERFHERGIVLSGDARLTWFIGSEANLDLVPIQVRGIACLDASDVRVISDSGEDVTPSERLNLLASAVSFIETPSGLKISEATAAEHPQC